MSEFNFENPSRQSIKGIIVIFGATAYKLIRGTIILIAAFLLKYFQSEKAQDVLGTKVLLFIAGFTLLFLIIAILRYLNFKFHLVNNHFYLRKGILNKEEISVALSKIQNVYIKQNLIQQVINVVSLSIETAGDDKTEIEITALKKAKANALKAQLLSEQKNDIDTESIEIQEAKALYYKASFKKLLLEGITENHLKSFVIILAFLMSTYNEVKDVVSKYEFTSQFKEWFTLDEQSLLALILLNVSIIVVLLLVSFLFSLIKMLIQNFDLTVVRTTKGLEISKGLLNKISLGLISSRIQTTTVSTNKIKRIAGLYKLSFTQAVANKKQQLNFNIVGLNLSQITELINEFYPKLKDDFKKQKPDKYLKYKLLWIGFLITVFVNIAFYFLPTSFLLLNIPLVLFIYGNAHFTYKKSYYHIDDNYIILGKGGFIETHTQYLELHKIQAIELKQTIFQKRRGLASLKLYSASKPLTIPHISITQALEIKNYLLYLIESQDKNWM